jgi:hypothetical protein
MKKQRINPLHQLCPGQLSPDTVRNTGKWMGSRVPRNAGFPPMILPYQPILGRRLGSSGLAGQGAGDAPVLKNNQRKSNGRGRRSCGRPNRHDPHIRTALGAGQGRRRETAGSARSSEGSWRSEDLLRTISELASSL